MRFWLACSLVLCSRLAFGAWHLNPAGATAVDAQISVVGSQFEYLKALVYLSNNTHHAFFGFRDPLVSTHPHQIWDVNLTDGTSRLINSTIGYPTQRGVGLLSPGGGTNIMLFSSGSPDVEILTYDPVSFETNHYTFTSPERSFGSACLGPDGKLYIGTYYRGKMYSYDPFTKTVKSDWGALDPDIVIAPPVGSRSNEWTSVYTIAVMTNWVFGAMQSTGSDPNWWYLTATRLSDTNHTVIWKDDGKTNNTTFRVYRNVDWTSCYLHQITNGVDKWWQLTNDVPVLLASPPTYYTFGNDVNDEPTTWASTGAGGATWNVEILPDTYSVQGSVAYAAMRYKLTSEGEYRPTIVQNSGWIGAPVNIIGLKPWAGGKMLWMSAKYGPLGFLTPNVLTETPGIYKYISGYDLLVHSPTEVYLAGYYQATMKWDPTQPWSIEPFLGDYTSSSINPHTVYNGMGIDHYFLTEGSGKLFIGVSHTRTSQGGELGWYNLSNGTKGSNRLDLVSSWFECNDVKAALSGTKIVYLGQTNVFVFDAVAFTIDSNFIVMGNQRLDKCVEYEPGKMFVIGGEYGTNMCAFTTTGSLIWSNNLPIAPWGGNNDPFEGSYYHKMELAPDNHVWVCGDDKLYRIDPTTGSYTNVMNVANNYNVTWKNGDAYLYGDPVIHRVPNLLLSDRTKTVRGAKHVGTLRTAP